MESKDQPMPRVRRSISLDKELAEWMDQHVEEKYEYRDRSHFIEVLIRRYKDSLSV